MAKHHEQTTRLLNRQLAAREDLKAKQSRELQELVSVFECEQRAVIACQPKPLKRARERPIPPRLSPVPVTGATMSDLQRFVRGLKRAARQQPEAHRFGGGIFLGPVCAAMLQRREVEGREHFRRLLQLARQRGLVRLARADLVAAMDPALVRESEFKDLNATWHFIHLEE